MCFKTNNLKRGINYYFIILLIIVVFLYFPCDVYIYSNLSIFIVSVHESYYLCDINII